MLEKFWQERKTRHPYSVCFYRRSMLRRCARTRSWEKKWQREKPQHDLRPTSKPSTTTTLPSLKTTPIPHPTCSPLSTTHHTPPYYYEATTAWNTTPRQWEVQLGLGVEKIAKIIQKKEKFSNPLFPKRMFLRHFKWEEKKIQLTSGSGYWFCKYFLFCYLQYDTSSKSIDCSVPFFCICFLSLHIYRCNNLFIFILYCFFISAWESFFLGFSCVVTGLDVCCEFAS